jgi:hypothetical protein
MVTRSYPRTAEAPQQVLSGPRLQRKNPAPRVPGRAGDSEVVRQNTGSKQLGRIHLGLPEVRQPDDGRFGRRREDRSDLHSLRLDRRTGRGRLPAPHGTRGTGDFQTELGRCRRAPQRRGKQMVALRGYAPALVALFSETAGAASARGVRSGRSSRRLQGSREKPDLIWRP